MAREFRSLSFKIRDGVATVTLGGGPGNRLHVGLIDELASVCDALEDDPTPEVLVLRGSGGVFSLGIDLSEFRGRAPDVHGFHRWEKVVTRIGRLPMATVAAVDGRAVGGGFQLVLACDLRLATARSTFSLPEVRMGFLPGMATWRLPRIVGLGVARRWVLTGQEIGAEEARAAGALCRIVPDGRLDEAVAEEVAALRPVNRVAHQLARRLLDESFAATEEEAVGHLLAAQARAIAQEPFLRTVEAEGG